MKAMVYHEYGPPDVLELQEIEKPLAKDDQVLVQVHAASVNWLDYHFLTGTPFLARILAGLLKPKNNVLGIDVAGRVEAVGSGVTEFQVGDQVFGRPDPALGAHAEYICIPEDGVLTSKPANMTWEEAASIPLAGNTALYFIRDLGNVQAGQAVLINGASGGIGTFAVQLAKYYGAEVTAVCSTTNVEMVKSLGADRVIDYTKEDFAKSGTYDVIFDVVGKTSFSRCRNSLKKKGLYLTTLPTMAIFLQTMWTFMVGGKKVKFGDALGKAENLIFFRELIEAGKSRPVIDRTYPLERIAEAFRYVEKGHKKGNVVITVEHNDKASSQC